MTNLNNTDVLNINEISKNCDILFDTARLLYARNINSVAKAKRFLNPSKNNFNNPFDLSCMGEVVDRIQLAKEREEKVLIFGDYDADGICASTILYNALKYYGINARPFVPEREDGYGLNYDKILSLRGDFAFSLVITVDCGISDREVVSLLKSSDIDVIVTDHHEPPNDLPNCLTINPKIAGQKYPFDGLCGAGVAYKLAYALIGEKANELLDFVALATVADSMDLIDENRDLVVEGLKLFSPTKIRECFKCLIGDADKKITASTLAYLIAPRVNAGGRMGDANCALKLFISENSQEIFELSVKLNSYNMERQAECDRVYLLAKERINKEKLYNNSVILVKGDNWNSGVIGIVCARLVEDYKRPVIAFALCDGYYKGSARSVEGVNVYDLISKAADLLKTFGGHSQAAGVSVDIDKYFDLYNRLLEVYDAEFNKEIVAEKAEFEWTIDNPISLRFAREINLLEPFGTGNKKPLFATNVGKINSKPLRANSPHYSFETDVIPMLDFNGEGNVAVLSYSVEKQIIFEINYSVFRNVESAKGFVKKIKVGYDNLDNLRYDIFSQTLNNVALPNHLEKYAKNRLIMPHIKAEIKSGFGTLYIINSIDNISKYPALDILEKRLFEVSDKSSKNLLLICPKSIPDGYSKVVFLDTFLSAPSGNFSVEQVYDLSGIEDYKSLSTNREEFANVFNILCAYANMPFSSFVSAYDAYAPQVDKKQFIFICSVFFELGFFSIENDLLKRNLEAKSLLTNSIIYSKICSIKEDL